MTCSMVLHHGVASLPMSMSLALLICTFRHGSRHVNDLRLCGWAKFRWRPRAHVSTVVSCLAVAEFRRADS